jgi:hypothetical protein
MSENRGTSHHQWIVGAVIVLAIVAAYFLLPPTRPLKNGNGPNRISGNPTPDECERLASQLNSAIGFLESDQLPKADDALVDLSQQFPNDPAAVRNLAICRVLLLEKLSPEEARRDPTDTLPAIDAAKKLEPRSPVPLILAARVATRQDNLAQAIAELEAAAKLAPDDAAVWYEVYNACRSASDEALRQTSRQAVAAALNSDPANSFLLKQQLIAEVQDKDRHALETLASLEAQIEPILPGVKQKIHVEFSEISRQLKTAVDEQKWPLAVSKAHQVNNAINSEEWVKSDLRRLEKHPLSYAVLEFNSGTCAARDQADEGPRIDVRFQALPAERQLPALDVVTDLKLADFDLDGVVDVIALTEGELSILARGPPSEPWKKSFAVAVRGPMRGLLVADLDRDGKMKAHVATPAPAADKPAEPPAHSASCQPADVEIVAFGPAGVQVFKNDLDDETGKRSLVPVPQTDDFENLRDVLAGVLADIDHDGDLDLVFSTSGGFSIWLNLGRLKFEDVTKRSAAPPRDLAATSLVAVDWDHDLDIDILVAGPGGAPAGWLENLRHGSLRWRAFEPELSRLSGSACLALIDVDGNGSWGVVGAGSKGINLARTRAQPAAAPKSVDFSEISPGPASASLVGDFDNDTHPDVLAWGETGLRLVWGASPPRFVAAENAFQPPAASAVACAAADIDGDGDLDLVVAAPNGPVIYDNVGGNQNHWLAVRTQGEDGDKNGDVNHLGIGSLLELKSGRRYQAQVVTGQVTHFGLGKKNAVDYLRVIWTNGVPQPAISPETDASLCRVHVFSSSCPYFYTWNGRQFEFCTDACWAAPLGLQLAEGVVAEPRAWEYLTVPGDRLRARDGKYLIQMTEELWEATYLDRMELIAVDHPTEFDIFSNEKVGPSEIAEFKIHTVRDRKLPVAARDKHGRNVLERISRADGAFMKGFDSDPRRGLTQEHFLELDLGPLSDPQRVTLFLTGWLYPASTSLRVGVSQDSASPAPRPPALEVPDENGSWRVARPFMGFPGGRTKTIAVDLSGIFPTGDHRLRIVTNMEFYWDAAFFTDGEEPAALNVTRLPVAKADLHYRGYSASSTSDGFGPDAYDYDTVSTAPKWAPMAGFFTRYGDVTELLLEDDDKQVIFGSGDELTVAFDVPENDLPSGWKRDFLLHNVGWDKDNDLNVISSQAVEPLPFQGMSGYPYRADEQFPETPRHREYLRKYQTRTQPPAAFWRHVRGFVREGGEVEGRR